MAAPEKIIGIDTLPLGLCGILYFQVQCVLGTQGIHMLVFTNHAQ